MDQLKLNWITRVRDKKKQQPERYLEVRVNDVPLLQIIAQYEAANGLGALGDDYVKETDLAETSALSWPASGESDSYIILLACNCGHWECSHLAVKSMRQDKFVYWQFAINQCYLEPYKALPEFWFDAAEYARELKRFFQLN